MLSRKEAVHDVIATGDFELFAGLTADEIVVIEQKLTRHEYSAGQQIMAQGEHASHLFLLAHGKVSIKLALPNGKIRRLATLSPGLVFGEMA